MHSPRFLLLARIRFNMRLSLELRQVCDVWTSRDSVQNAYKYIYKPKQNIHLHDYYNQMFVLYNLSKYVGVYVLHIYIELALPA